MAPRGNTPQLGTSGEVTRRKCGGPNPSLAAGQGRASSGSTSMASPGARGALFFVDVEMATYFLSYEACEVFPPCADADANVAGSVSASVDCVCAAEKQFSFVSCPGFQLALSSTLAALSWQICCNRNKHFIKCIGISVALEDGHGPGEGGRRKFGF